VAAAVTFPVDRRRMLIATVLGSGGSGSVPSGVLLTYSAGDSLADATFARTGDATFTADIVDTLLTYSAGASLSAATFARTGDATYNADV
jgi:hypothetical protein